MTFSLRRFYVALLLLPVSGCVPILFAGGAETAVIVSQERSAGMAVDDAGIVLSIKALFAKQENTDMFENVEIKSIEGRVLLTGNVDKPESQIEAVRLAWTVNNVREVIDEIQISDKSGFTNYARDVWISTQVRSRLLFGKHIRSVNYSVITVNQVVYLMGVAQNQDELDRATYVASTTGSVQRVVSYVRMKDDPSRGYPQESGAN